MKLKGVLGLFILAKLTAAQGGGGSSPKIDRMLTRIMSLFAATGGFWNKSDTLNGTGVQQEEGRNYSALLYALLILVVVFGNTLVCLAVLRERALQTSTNYLVVSLAVADLLVAILVMPWVVYLEVRGHSSHLFTVVLLCLRFCKLDHLHSQLL